MLANENFLQVLAIIIILFKFKKMMLYDVLENDDRYKILG